MNLSIHRRRAAASLLAALALLFVPPANANLGQLTLPAGDTDGAVVVFYPTDAPEGAERRGPFTLSLAPDAAPAPGNGRLIVVSHGSGGAPWAHADLARALVGAGFVVALPWHRGDNALDARHPGPDSWSLRPGEVSRAIDRLGSDARFGVRVDQVGVFGMSAGGHTALSMAGGRWSRATLRRHCDAHIAEDFQACVGLNLQQRGDVFDPLRRWLALAVIDHRLTDETLQAHADSRVAAVVAAVPFAADFDMSSLSAPEVPLALVTSGKDLWLPTRFHAGQVLAACARCVHLLDLPTGGHGAWMSPLPSGLHGLAADLINDPPGFDRRALGPADAAIVAFFRRHLASVSATGR